MSGILRRRRCCCGGEPMGCVSIYGCAPTEYVPTIEDPYATARSHADGGPTIYKGGNTESYLWDGPGWLFDGVEGNKKCRRAIVFRQAVISRTVGETYLGISGGSGPTVLRNPIISDGFAFYPAFAAGGTKASPGSYLTSKPAFMECLGVAGVPGGSFWASMPTVSSIMAFLSGDKGTQGESYWWRTDWTGAGGTDLPFADGALVDVAMIFTNQKRCTDRGAHPRTYEDESDGNCFLNEIRVGLSRANTGAFDSYPD